MCIYRDHACYLYLQLTVESRQINRALVVPLREYRAELSTSSRTSLIFHSIDSIQNIPRRRLSRRTARVLVVEGPWTIISIIASMATLFCDGWMIGSVQSLRKASKVYDFFFLVDLEAKSTRKSALINFWQSLRCTRTIIIDFVDFLDFFFVTPPPYKKKKSQKWDFCSKSQRQSTFEI